MIDWLYTIPQFLLVVLPALTLVLLLVGLSWLVHRRRRLAITEQLVDIVLRIEMTLFSMTSLVLAFTLVQVDINYRQADMMVTAEGSRIDQLDRLLARYGDPQVTALRQPLRAYTRSIIDDEWPEMLSEAGNDKTNRLFATVSHGLLSIDPATPRQSMIFAEMLRALDGASTSRADRLNSVTLGLPSLYWEMIGLALVVLIAVTCTAATTRFRTAILAAQVMSLGIFLGFVFIMDRPFQGRHAIAPETFEHVLVRMEQRTE